jgi:aspartate/methionine/tyrosine aminotransferase
VVALPNPFYPVYAVGALTLGAEPLYLPATAATGFLPDLEAFARRPDVERVSLFYLCSPGNPQGAVAGTHYWARLLDLAERHDFIVVADECYSEIWRDAPPPGALQVAEAIGADRARIVAIQSLSKRSNLPGLRSGFAAGSAEAIGRMLQLRAYAGAPLPLPVQHVSARAWAEEAHVEASRLRYAAKYEIADEVLGGMPGYAAPEAGFFLWIAVGDGEEAALRLWRETGVRVLPGAYLAREVDGQNPGQGFVRAAMVAGEDEIRDGLARVRACLGG